MPNTELINWDAYYGVCENCGCPIASWSGNADSWTHIAGSYRGKHRCGSESGQPYGLEATPKDEGDTK